MQFDSSATPRKSKSKYNELLRTILLLVQHAIFDYLMQEFYVVFDQKWQANLKNCAESSLPSSGSDEASGNLLESNTSEAAMGSKKRTRTNPEEDRPDRGGKDDPKKLKLGPEMADRRLACPYHKRDPQEFGVGTTHHVCAGQGWKDIAKLK
jgi:hypothetical protein